MSRLWFACEQPERPPDAYVMWHYGEECCHLKAEVQGRRFPDDPNVARLVSLWGGTGA